MCKHFRKEHLCALQVFLCALVSLLCVCARAHSLEGTLSMTSSVKFLRFPFLCRRMYPIGTSEEQQCCELLNFVIQLDLISSFHDSVAPPGNDGRGAQYEFSSPPLPEILFS